MQIIIKIQLKIENMKIIKKNQLKIVIFTAVKYYSILYGRVIVMIDGGHSAVGHFQSIKPRSFHRKSLIKPAVLLNILNTTNRISIK